jgi:hypothetical protein
MTATYLRSVRTHLRELPTADRRRAMEALSAQLDELADAGIDPRDALGEPADFAAHLHDALEGDAPTDAAQWRVLGVPVDTRGPIDADVRARTWDPTNPRLVVPRLFGAGWTLNLGAVAVRLGLLRPDDISDDVIERIPSRHVRVARSAPLLIAGAAATALALSWRSLPGRVPSGFDLGGRTRSRTSRASLLAVLALGALPALWAQRPTSTVDDTLVRAASATSLAVLSAGNVAAIIAQARAPHARWGLLVPASLPLAAAASLTVIVAPLRAGLRRVWSRASITPSPATKGPQENP